MTTEPTAAEANDAEATGAAKAATEPRAADATGAGRTTTRASATEPTGAGPTADAAHAVVPPAADAHAVAAPADRPSDAGSATADAATAEPAGADALLTEVRDLLAEDGEAPAEDDNLIEWGLDSIALMRLAAAWRRAGAEVSFGALAADPTLGAWRALLADAAPTGPAPGEPAPTRSTPARSATTEPTPAPEGAPFPLAPLQHAYWIGRQEGQRWGGVAAHLYTEFDGPAPDPARLARAVAALLRRHPMLRVTLSGDGTQRVLPDRTHPPLVLADLRDADPDRVEAGLRELRDRRSHQILDVEAGEVFQLGLTLLPGGRARLHLDVDMVAADARSYRVLVADLARAYRDDAELGAAAAYGYRRYLDEHRAATAAAAERDAAWWAGRLAELPGAPELPVDERAADPGRIGRRFRRLPAGVRDRLAARANRHGVTLAMTLATAYAEVLGGWSANSRFLLNLPLFDREPLHPDVAGLVGDFTSSVLLDVDLAEPLPFAERAARLQAQLHGSAAHAAFSGVDVLRELTRARGEQVVAPAVFTSALGLGELFDPVVREQFGEPVWIVSQGPQVLLDAQVTEVDGGVLVNWDVRENLLRPGVADAMFTLFTGLLDRLAGDDAAWGEPVTALLPREQRGVRDTVNDTAADLPARRLHDAFFAHAARTPGAPALLWGEDGRWTYAELADRALRVAAALRERGVRPGDAVGVHLPKGPEQVAAVIGVLASGGCYLPVGWDQPARRVAAVTATAGCRVVVTADGGALPAGLTALPAAEALTWAERAAGPAPGSPGDLAYLLFTSGSTGRPKGVEVPHAAAANTLDDLLDRYGVGAADRTLGVSAMEFDLSVFDVSGPLSAGGAVVVVREEERRDPAAWLRLMRGHGVSVLNCVPSLLDMMLVTAGDAEAADGLGERLRLVLLGGDWVGADLPRRLFAHLPECRFAGLGGTTETAIHSTVCEVAGGEVPAAWRSVPYGTPLRNVVCRVVDGQGRDRPDWAVGELWIGGAGVAAGYRGDPARTADRFVGRDPRWYRTGDLARYRPDGTLEFLGRADHQVKLRGYRIELGEVEAALAAQPGVRRAVARLSPRLGGSLQAVATADPGVSAEALRTGAAALLPAYMVPETVLVVPDLPLTRNGKPDRPAVAALLDAHAGASPGTAPVAPRTPLEEVLLTAWRAALADQELGVEDDFLAHGGDSVLATRVVAALREELQTDRVRVRDVFTSRTVAAMATALLTEDPAWSEIARIALEVSRLSDEAIERELDQAH
jgi:mycobactin phenyloxazoline synthetase